MFIAGVTMDRELVEIIDEVTIPTAILWMYMSHALHWLSVFGMIDMGGIL